jgi:hypothetical protein
MWEEKKNHTHMAKVGHIAMDGVLEVGKDARTGHAV